jgi:transposase
MPPTSQPHQKHEVKTTNYVGINIGKNRCAACVADEKGEILRELTYLNTRSGIEELAEKLARYGECRAVLESRGTCGLRRTRSWRHTAYR